MCYQTSHWRCNNSWHIFQKSIAKLSFRGVSAIWYQMKNKCFVNKGKKFRVQKIILVLKCQRFHLWEALRASLNVLTVWGWCVCCSCPTKWQPQHSLAFKQKNVYNTAKWQIIIHSKKHSLINHTECLTSIAQNQSNKFYIWVLTCCPVVVPWLTPGKPRTKIHFLHYYKCLIKTKKKHVQSRVLSVKMHTHLWIQAGRTPGRAIL